jgi:hypothetical protein
MLDRRVVVAVVSSPFSKKEHRVPDLPPDIKQQIRLHAESEWPDDFEMQKHVVDSQSDAYWQLQALAVADGDNLIIRQAIAHAASEWIDDFEMQLHTAQNQIASAQAFFSFKLPGVPEQVMDKIRAKAVADWPDDREMQMHTLRNQVEAWLSLNG